MCGSKYFNTYLIKKEDFAKIISIAKRLYASKLFNPLTLKGLRIVTFDSKNIFVISKEIHKTFKNIKVERVDLFPAQKTSFNIFTFSTLKRKRRLTKEIFEGATAWFEKNTIIKTAVDNNLVVKPTNLAKEKAGKVLKTIFIPPPEPFNKIHKGKFDYETDVIFHETAHLEGAMITGWFHYGKFDYSIDNIFRETTHIPSILAKNLDKDKKKKPFSSFEKERLFFKTINKAKYLSPRVLKNIKKFINKAAVGELYALIIDREAKRRFKPIFLKKNNQEIQKDINSTKAICLNSESQCSRYFQNLSDYSMVHLLIPVIEYLFPNFYERKKWFCSVFKNNN